MLLLIQEKGTGLGDKNKDVRGDINEIKNTDVYPTNLSPKQLI